MRRGRIRIVALALWITASGSAHADQVDEFIKKEMARQRIPGLSLAVIKDGKTVKSAGYGLADRQRQTPATPATVYKIGSVSKQFVATGIMLLVQEGRLGLDDPISKYLEGTPSAWSPITIRHLLTHTSGIVREAPAFDWNKAQSDADVVQSAYALPLRFKPGDKWEYSNTPYFALAEVIHKVSGQPWENYLTEKVFSPLGMNFTRATNTNTRLPNRAAGYRDNDRLLDAPDWQALRPSGAFFSTVQDLARWDAALDSNRILSESSRRLMWTRVSLNDGSSGPYGLGWYVDELDGHRRVHHGGGIPGFSADFSRFPDAGVTVIVLVNLDDNNIEAIADGVATIYLRESSPAR